MHEDARSLVLGILVGVVIFGALAVVTFSWTVTHIQTASLPTPLLFVPK